MTTPASQVHAKISGPIVMIGFGSIGKGTLPLIERHFNYDKSRFVIIDPHENGEIAKQHGVRFIKQAITRDNYREVLVPLLTAGGGQGFCVNLSVDTSSVDIMTMCREIGALYIDTVIEPWLGFYFDKSAGPEKRSNYALRAVAWLLLVCTGFLLFLFLLTDAARFAESFTAIKASVTCADSW